MKLLTGWYNTLDTLPNQTQFIIDIGQKTMEVTKMVTIKKKCTPRGSLDPLVMVSRIIRHKNARLVALGGAPARCLRLRRGGAMVRRVPRQAQARRVHGRAPPPRARTCAYHLLLLLPFRLHLRLLLRGRLRRAIRRRAQRTLPNEKNACHVENDTFISGSVGGNSRAAA